MVKHFAILDERRTWAEPAIAAAKARGYTTQHIPSGARNVGDIQPGGLFFIRPHADPLVLKRNQKHDYDALRVHADAMVQDRAQVDVYENKTEQWKRWGSWMPDTWHFLSLMQAWEFVHYHADYPLVSKANVGASSYNVRILRDRKQAEAHVEEIFGKGIVVDHCAGGPGGGKIRSKQMGYVLLQEFLEHDTTWRVNKIGRALAAFKRYNHPVKGTAQTGNVEPVMHMDEQVGDLFAFAREVFRALDTRWCAIDILWDKRNHRWRLLETSLAWPWPSPGDCDSAPFFGITRHRWSRMWDLLLDEYEAGVWAS